MAFFKYTAKNKGIQIKGVLEATTQREAYSKLKKQGFQNIILEISNNPGADRKLKSLSLKEKIDFTQTFQTLHQAGVPILDSLVFIGNEAASARMRNVARTIRQDILEGGTFAGSVVKYPDIFDKTYSGLIKAGEDSGELDKTLIRLSDLLKKQAGTKAKVIGAMLYPVFVIVLAIIIVLVMVTFVFPKFAETFAATGRELPAITQVCINFGTSIQNYWYVYIAGVALLIWLIVKSFQWGPSREIIDKCSLQIPIIRNLVINSNFSNFLTVLMVAYNAGIPIVDCVYLANLTITNVVIRDALVKANKEIQQGRQLSVAMRNALVVPRMVVFMISTGEQSGRLGDLLDNVVYFIDQELDKTVDAMTQMMEPMLIIVIGVIVLFMALAFYLPLFGLSQGF